MPEPGLERPQGTSSQDARPSASSTVAELWSQREQAIPAPPDPPAQGRAGRPPKESKTGPVVAVVALALLLGGGVGVFLATQGVGGPSVEKFAAKADDVCRPANATMSSIAKPTSYPELATAAGSLVAATDAQLEGLRSMKGPGGADGSRVGVVVAAMTQTNAAGRTLQDAAGRKDDAATAAATRRMRASATEASTAATSSGLTACATGMQAGVDAVAGGAGAVVKTAFIAKADTLCRAAARTVAAIPLPRNDPRDVQRYISAAIQFNEKFMADFKAIPVPPGDEAAVGDIVQDFDRAHAITLKVRDAASASDRARLIADSAPLETAVDAKLDAYGLAVCGSNFRTL